MGKIKVAFSADYDKIREANGKEATKLPRFFLSPDEIGERFITLRGEAAQHAKVLRLRNGEAVTVCDGCGTDYDCTVSDVSDGQYSLVVHSVNASGSEPKVRASVYMAFPKSDKLEHVIQKATELGAAEIVAFPSSRCVVKNDAKSLAKKLDRWQKIAESAAEQSGRGVIPKVIAVESYRAAIERACQADLAINFYENETGYTFHDALSEGAYQTVALMTGPEGGFSREEIAQAQAAGMKICTLGTRILRCETAPLCALSALMYACGEF